MKHATTPLRDKALLARQRALVRKYEELSQYQQMALRDALSLKLEKIVGVEYDIEIEAGESEHELFATVDGLRFLGVREPHGDIYVVWVARCPKCGGEHGGRLLTGITDLGEDLAEFDRTSRIGKHQCTGTPAKTPSETSSN